MSDHSFFSNSRLFRISFVILVLLILGIFGFYSMERWRGESSWKEYRTGMEARGEVFEFSKLIEPVKPAEANFASTPFLKPLFLSNKVPTGPASFHFRREYLNDSGRKRALNFGQNLPDSPRVVPWMWGEKLSAKDREMKKFGKSIPEESFEQFLEKNREVLDEISKALEFPESRFGISYEDNYSALLPHLGILRKFCLIFAWQSCMQLESGKLQEAFESAVKGLKVSGAVRSEPVLISQVVRIAMFHQALQPIYEGLASHSWSREQLLEFRSELEKLNFLADFQFALRGERVFNNEFVGDMIHNPRFIAEKWNQLGNQSSPSDDPKILRAGSLAIPSGWLYKNLVQLNRLYDEQALKMVDPSQNRFHKEKLEAFNAAIQKSSGPFSMISKMLLPALSPSAAKFASAQNSLQMATIACSLEMEFLKNGKYPTNLSELNLPAKYRHDVIDGAPLRFQAQTNAFVLYSIGLNGVDDAGELPDNKKSSFPFEEGDWVWKSQPRP